MVSVLNGRLTYINKHVSSYGTMKLTLQTYRSRSEHICGASGRSNDQWGYFLKHRQRASGNINAGVSQGHLTCHQMKYDVGQKQSITCCLFVIHN